MKYNDFEYDFVERTLSNIEWIEKQNSIDNENRNALDFYEVTNFINQCLGLIILPSQFSDKIFLKNFPQELSYYGVGDHIVNKIKDNKQKTLSNVMRHIRNGIAHGHIQQVIDGSDDITDVKIWDVDQNIENPTEKDAHTIIEFRVEELKLFAINVAKEYCKFKKEELDQAIN